MPIKNSKNFYFEMVVDQLVKISLWVGDLYDLLKFAHARGGMPALTFCH